MSSIKIAAGLNTHNGKGGTEMRCQRGELDDLMRCTYLSYTAMRLKTSGFENCRQDSNGTCKRAMECSSILQSGTGWMKTSSGQLATGERTNKEQAHVYT